MAKRPTGFLPFILVPTTLAAGAFLAAPYVSPYLQSENAPDVEETATADPLTGEELNLEDSVADYDSFAQSDAATDSVEIANADSVTADSVTSEQADDEQSPPSTGSELTDSDTSDQLAEAESNSGDADNDSGDANEAPGAGAVVNSNSEVYLSHTESGIEIQAVEIPDGSNSGAVNSTVAPVQRTRIDFSRSALLSVNSAPAPLAGPMPVQRIRVMRPAVQPAIETLPFPIPVEIESATEAVRPATDENVGPQDAENEAGEELESDVNAEDATHTEAPDHEKSEHEKSEHQEKKLEIPDEKVAHSDSSETTDTVTADQQLFDAGRDEAVEAILDEAGEADVVSTSEVQPAIQLEPSGYSIYSPAPKPRRLKEYDGN